MKEHIDPRIKGIEQYLASGEIKEGHYYCNNDKIEISISKQHIFEMEIYNSGEKCKYINDSDLMRDCIILYEEGRLKLVLREKLDYCEDYITHDSFDLVLNTGFSIISERISRIKKVSIERYIDIWTIDGESICPGKSYLLWNAVDMAGIRDKITQSGFRGRKIKTGRQQWENSKTTRDVILKLW